MQPSSLNHRHGSVIFPTTFRPYRPARPGCYVAQQLIRFLPGQTIFTCMLTGEVPRARRYEVAFAIQYRQRRQRRWYTGVTRNVSASGVLFGEAAANEELELDAPLEMELTIPSGVAGGKPTRIFCSGRVARIVDVGTAGGSRIVAATIVKYRLRRSN